jgi:hypothetical protein
MATSTLGNTEFNELVNACMARVNVKKTDWLIAQTAIDPVETLLTEWNTKYASTLNKKMTTTAAREARDLVRGLLEPVFSDFIEVSIYRNKNMNDADVSSCGLEPRKKTHTPSGKPATIPQMEYVAGQSHTLKGYYRQAPGAAGVSKRGKPKGVGRCQIAYAMLDTKPDNPNPTPPVPPVPPSPDDNPLLWNPDDFPKRIDGTKNPVVLTFLPAEAGKYVIMAARWVSTSNIEGDWGLLEVMMVP